VYTRRAAVLGDGPVADLVVEDLSREADFELRRVSARQHDLGSPDVVRAQLEDAQAVISAVPAPQAAHVLRSVLQAKRPCVDVGTEVSEALGLESLTHGRDLSACVGCGIMGVELAIAAARPAAAGVRWSLRGEAAEKTEQWGERVAALMAAALARRVVSGDFRGHPGVWTPERLGRRVGMLHGLLADLKERGIDVRLDPR
jgi:hypothetical protein